MKKGIQSIKKIFQSVNLIAIDLMVNNDKNISLLPLWIHIFLNYSEARFNGKTETYGKNFSFFYIKNFYIIAPSIKYFGFKTV